MEPNYEDFLNSLKLDAESKPGFKRPIADIAQKYANTDIQRKAREIVFDEKDDCYKYEQRTPKPVWIITILKQVYSKIEERFAEAYTNIAGVWCDQKSADAGFRNMLREIDMSRVTSLEADFERYRIFYSIPNDMKVWISMDKYMAHDM